MATHPPSPAPRPPCTPTPFPHQLPSFILTAPFFLCYLPLSSLLSLPFPSIDAAWRAPFSCLSLTLFTLSLAPTSLPRPLLVAGATLTPSTVVGGDGALLYRALSLKLRYACDVIFALFLHEVKKLLGTYIFVTSICYWISCFSAIRRVSALY